MEIRSCKKDHVKIEHLNAQSLPCHLDEIKFLVEEREVDILCISETWLGSNMPDNFIAIPNFNLYRCDYGRGGGTCIYARRNLKVTVMNVGIDKVEGVEDVWINVQRRMLPSVVIGCIYRHPKATVRSFEYISEVFKVVCIRKKPVFIVGDLNDDQFNPNNKLTKIIKKLNLKQLINKATRITSLSSTLLDVVITNKSEMVLHSDVIPSPVADHELISFTVNIEKPKKIIQSKSFRCLKNYSSDYFSNILLENTSKLNSILETDDVNAQVDIFRDVFIDSLDKCAPLITKKVTRPSAPWITDDIKQSMQSRNIAQQTLKDDRSNIFLQNQYKSAKRRVKQQIRNGKKKYFRDKLSEAKGDSKATWKAVRELVPKTKINAQNSNYENVQEKAEEFNQFFANVGKNAFEKSQENLLNRPTEDDETANLNDRMNISQIPYFRPQPVDIDTVILTFKQLNDTRACGSDDIPLRFLKDALQIIIFYVTIIVNTSIVTGLYPNSWKYPYVIPFHKNGDEEDVNNFRPISLLPIISKILEKIVANQLMSFLESNQLLSNCQHGFRSRLSTETALIKVTEKLYSNMENKKISLLILLDLSKAFDSISHEILLNKFEKLRIDPFWFRDYLQNRKQAVRLSSNLSSALNVEYGVPQGSIMGPNLFNIHVDDMSKYFRDCTLVQYADDSQIILTGNINDIEDLIRRAENVLIKAKSYFQANGLNLNEGKTQCMFIGTKQYISRISNDVRIQFGEVHIQPSSCVKNLGVFLDQTLSFNMHIDEMAKRVYGTLSFINRISDQLDKATRINVVQSLVMTVINYGSKIWGITTKQQIERVQRLQNFAAKVAVGGARKFDHVSPIIEELEWLKIDKKILYDICIMVYNVVKHHLPCWLFTLPTVQEVNNARPTRQSQDLFVPRTRTDMGKKLFTVKGPTIWNELPEMIKGSPSVHIFRNRIKKYLFVLQKEQSNSGILDQ